MTDDDDAIRRITPLIPVHTIDIDKLSRDLDKAYQTFQRDPLEGWHHALVVLQPLLKATDPNRVRGHRHMFNSFADQLYDLRRGRQPEQLRKRKLQHRPPDSIETWRLRAIAAHAADLLELTGLTRDEAHRQVIARCKQSGFPVNSGVRSAAASKVFAGWRSALIAGRAPREGLVAYGHLRAQTVEVPSSTPKGEFRRQILQALENELRADKSSGKAQKDADSD